MATVNESLAVANRLHSQGRLEEAEQLTSQVLAVQPKNSIAWHLLGRIVLDLQRPDAAAAHIKRSLELQPQNPVAHLDLGRAFQSLGNLTDAAASFRSAVQQKPDFAEAHSNLGLVYEHAARIDEAAEHYRRALELSPNFAIGHYNLGNVLQMQGRPREAIASYHKAIELNPDLAVAHNALGAALQLRGDLVQAANCYERALTLQPLLAPAHVNRAQLRLLTGDFEQGWPEYEWRWKTGQIPIRVLEQPRWDGRPLPDQTLLIYGEQGLGDLLHFVRFAPLAKQRLGTVLVECPKSMIPLLKSFRGIDRFIGVGDELPHFDVQSPLLSLPAILQTSLDTIPRDVPYLFADPTLVAKWRNPIAAIGGFGIGINWSGRPGHEQSRQRDIPLECFETLLQHPAVRLVCLQKGAQPQQLLGNRSNPPIVDFGDTLDANGAFTDTAAIMMNLDLLITSDTSIAHLAGALGIPVWVPLTFIPEWRWLLDRADSPWYPTMRLFRQKSPGDWSSAFAEIQTALRHRIDSGLDSQRELPS